MHESIGMGKRRHNRNLYVIYNEQGSGCYVFSNSLANPVMKGVVCCKDRGGLLQVISDKSKYKVCRR